MNVEAVCEMEISQKGFSKKHIPQNEGIYLNSFGVSLLSFADFGCRDVCPLSNIMELNGPLLTVLKAP